MIGATIDIYHDEIAQAIYDNDSQRIAEIARMFYCRNNNSKPWSIIDAELTKNGIDGVVVDLVVQFRSGEVATLSMSTPHGKQKVTLRGEHISVARMDQAVEALGVPMAFLDGIYFMASCAIESSESSIGRLFHERQWMEGSVRNLREETKRLREELSELSDAVELVAGFDGTRAVDNVDYKRAEHIASLYAGVPCNEFVSPAEAKYKLSGISGLYFAWLVTTGKCVYVGKSKNIGSRVSPSRHELRGCKITWLEMPQSEMHVWELFYIWLLRPERNGEVVESENAKQTGEENGR